MVNIPPSMKKWHGGDSAPADWDGGDVILDNGEWGDGNVWDHHPSRDGKIIAYTPKPSTGATAPIGVEREAIIRAVSDPGTLAGFRGWRSIAEWTADAILATLSRPSVIDPAAIQRMRANIGAETDEPSLGEMVLDYYRRHVEIGEAFNLRDQYFAALQPHSGEKG